MKVSLEIQNKMHKLAKYVEQSKVLTEEIDHYFDAKGFRYGLVTSFLHKYYDGGYKGAGDSVEKPLPTVITV